MFVDRPPSRIASSSRRQINQSQRLPFGSRRPPAAVSRSRRVLTGRSVFRQPPEVTRRLTPGASARCSRSVGLGRRAGLEFAQTGVISRHVLIPNSLRIPGVDRPRSFRTLGECRAGTFEECSCRGADFPVPKVRRTPINAARRERASRRVAILGLFPKHFRGFPVARRSLCFEVENSGCGTNPPGSSRTPSGSLENSLTLARDIRSG